jgi:CBS domain-containing protein
VVALVEGGFDPLEVGRVVTGTIDAITRRLIDLAVSELGDPPVPWAWVALGSAARREQGIRTDQDHALAYDRQGRSLEELDPYFLRLAEYVTSGLASAGIPRCHADVVAANQALRRPVEHWVEAFETWMSDPRIESVRQTTILFDYRRVAGPLDVEESFHRIISTSPQRPAFIGRLRRMAIDARPRRRVRVPRRIDLKHDGIMQIVSLARILALEGDIRETNTLERLRLATDRGLLDESTAARLTAAFRLMWGTRLEQQIAVASEGARSGDLVDTKPRELRGRLGEALAVIREAQDALWRNPASRGMIGGEAQVPSLEAA